MHIVGTVVSQASWINFSSKLGFRIVVLCSGPPGEGQGMHKSIPLGIVGMSNQELKLFFGSKAGVTNH